MASQFLPVLITLGLAFVTGIGLIGVAIVFAQRARTTAPAKSEPFESGVPLLDRAQKRISVKFYIVALVFVVLDVEVAFLYPWAITFREMTAVAGWIVLFDMVAFVSLLAVVYSWLWKGGVFDWGAREDKVGLDSWA